MSADENPRPPTEAFTPPKPFVPTLYPRRVFAPPPRRPLAELGDRLLALVVKPTAPDAPPGARPRPRLRPLPGAPKPAPKQPQRSLRETTRRWNDVLGIWRLCDEDACRRRGRCCGDPLLCLPRHLPAVPEPTRLWFACLGLAAQKNVAFTDALAIAAREGEAAVCARWHQAVARALPPQRNTTARRRKRPKARPEPGE